MSGFASCRSDGPSPLHQMFELTRLFHVHALFITLAVEGLVQQTLTLHEVNLQSHAGLETKDS